MSRYATVLRRLDALEESAASSAATLVVVKRQHVDPDIPDPEVDAKIAAVPGGGGPYEPLVIVLRSGRCSCEPCRAYLARRAARRGDVVETKDAYWDGSKEGPGVSWAPLRDQYPSTPREAAPPVETVTTSAAPAAEGWPWNRPPPPPPPEPVPPQATFYLTGGDTGVEMVEVTVGRNVWTREATDEDRRHWEAVYAAFCAATPKAYGHKRALVFKSLNDLRSDRV